MAALWQRRKFRRRRRRRLCILVVSGGSRVQGGAAEEGLGVNLSEILDASVGHSEVSLKLGLPGTESKDFNFRC